MTILLLDQEYFSHYRGEINPSKAKLRAQSLKSEIFSLFGEEEYKLN